LVLFCKKEQSFLAFDETVQCLPARHRRRRRIRLRRAEKVRWRDAEHVAERAQVAAHGGGGADGFAEGGVLHQAGELGGVGGCRIGQEAAQPGAGAGQALFGQRTPRGGFCAWAAGRAARRAAVGAGMQAGEEGHHADGDGTQAATCQGDQPLRQQRAPRRESGAETVGDARELVG
jgi:hypothetical protein